MRVAIYVSDEHAAPEAQLPPLRAWCMAGGHEVVEEYIDYGVAAAVARRERPWRPRCRDLYKQVPLFDCVLAWSMAQFFRDGLDGTLYVVGQLKADGISFLVTANQASTMSCSRS